MRTYEHPYKHDVDPRILDRYLRELHQTSEAISDFRVSSGLGAAGLHEQDRSRKKHHDPRQDFAQAAHLFTERNNLDSDTHMYASLLSVVPSMLRGKRTLEYGDRFGHYAAKMQMIKFNDVIRSIADTHPSLDPEILTHIVGAVAQDYGYGSGGRGAAMQETRNTARGIKHELGVEAELSWLPEEFEVLPTNDDDDKRGADDRVLYRPTDTIVDIDVKASQEAADNAIQDEKEFQQSKGHGYMVPVGKLILYSGFTDDDFEPQRPWRVKQAAIQRELPRVESLIREAAGADDRMAVAI
jgi:hypothetical protein